MEGMACSLKEDSQGISSEEADSRTYNVREVDMFCLHFSPICQDATNHNATSLSMNLEYRLLALLVELVSYDFYLPIFWD